MIWRCLIRFSINRDNGTLTTYLSKQLVNDGFSKVGTGEYQAHSRSLAPLAIALQNYYFAIEDPQAAFPGASIPQGVHIDHIWTHMGSVNDH